MRTPASAPISLAVVAGIAASASAFDSGSFLKRQERNLP
jgi:hypothetical protein